MQKNNKERISALVLSDKGKKPELVEFSTDNLLDEAKAVTDFVWATMPTYSIEGHNFDFICDDEGLLVNDPVVTVFGKDILYEKPDLDDPAFTYPIRLCGSLAVIHSISFDKEGNEIYDDLADEEIKLLQDHIAMYQRNDGRIIYALVGIDYPVPV